MMPALYDPATGRMIEVSNPGVFLSVGWVRPDRGVTPAVAPVEPDPGPEPSAAGVGPVGDVVAAPAARRRKTRR